MAGASRVTCQLLLSGAGSTVPQQQTVSVKSPTQPVDCCMLAPIAQMSSPLEAADQHCYILKSLVASLAEVGGDGAGGVSCKRDHPPAPGRRGLMP